MFLISLFNTNIFLIYIIMLLIIKIIELLIDEHGNITILFIYFQVKRKTKYD
jgi:hypothetical protein